MTNYKTLRLILGDQLNELHSWYDLIDEDTLYVLMEIKSESDYVTHHIQKVIGMFHAMRSFASKLLSQGHKVRYFKISDTDNLHSFSRNIGTLMEQRTIEKIEYQEPDEYRLDELLKKELGGLGPTVTTCSSEHFYTERKELQNMFLGKRQYLMETFYRKMRTKHDVLMEDGKPYTGRWNYDQENRKKLPKGHVPMPPKVYAHDVSDILDEIHTVGLDTIGRVDASKFLWPADREEVVELFEYFLNHLLVNFGRFQDALSDDYWSVYHSRISFGLNLKMISPREVIDRVEEYYGAHVSEIGISQVEGFIRQILGWREYMRGI